MPSPFPGMEPYLESWEWESFHAAFIVDVGDVLSPLVQPQYVARPQRRVYVEYPPTDGEPGRVADAAVFESSDPSERVAGAAAHLATAIEPVEVLLPMPVERIETYLTIREIETREVITVIELLSPSNKRGGSGRREYLEKRQEILQSETNLVELDLLRGGNRLPMDTPLPAADYYAIVSRAGKRPRASAYAWSLRQRMPPIPIPLRAGEPDVVIELQPIFDSRYVRGNYGSTLKYAAAPMPPFRDADARWAGELLGEFRMQPAAPPDA